MRHKNRHIPIEPLLSVTSAAKSLGIGRTLMYKLMYSQQLPYVRVGKTRRIESSAIRQFIERNSVGVFDVR